MKYRKPGRPPSDDEACGTPHGYSRHWHRGESACPACCKARAQYEEDKRLAPIRREILAEAISRRGPRKPLPPLEWDGQPPYGDRREAIEEGGAA